MRCASRARDALQVQRRTGEHFEAALQHAAGGVDAGLVLVEALRRRIAAHADVHAVRTAAAIGEIQQHQVDVAAAAAGGAEAERHLVHRRQAIDVAHRQPLGNRGRGAPPQRRERRLDARGASRRASTTRECSARPQRPPRSPARRAAAPRRAPSAGRRADAPPAAATHRTAPPRTRPLTRPGAARRHRRAPPRATRAPPMAMATGTTSTARGE